MCITGELLEIFYKAGSWLALMHQHYFWFNITSHGIVFILLFCETKFKTQRWLNSFSSIPLNVSWSDLTCFPMAAVLSVSPWWINTRLLQSMTGEQLALPLRWSRQEAEGALSACTLPFRRGVHTHTYTHTRTNTHIPRWHTRLATHLLYRFAQETGNT